MHDNRMSLAPGTRLGAYEVHSLIGVGGMGEVYLAHDTNLKRDVALKILPESFALDADRLARFKREAQLLASLIHPNIAAIYGFEESNGIHALVLELVEGPTLADRLLFVEYSSWRPTLVGPGVVRLKPDATYKSDATAWRRSAKVGPSTSSMTSTRTPVDSSRP